MPGFLRPPPPKKILLSLQYMSNYVGKIIQTRWGWWTHCNISQNCVSKCTRLHLSAYSFQKIFVGGRGEPPDPLRMLVAFGRSGLLPYMINPRYNPARCFGQRGTKNYALSSGTSSYQPYKIVHPQECIRIMFPEPRGSRHLNYIKYLFAHDIY